MACPTNPRRVEHEHFAACGLEHFLRALHAWRRHAEHRRRHDRPVLRRVVRCAELHESRHRRRLTEHAPADAVEAEHVDDAVLEHQVSLSPTKDRTWPDVSVNTITFDAPIAARASPPCRSVAAAEPPSPSTPSNSPRAWRSSAITFAPRAAAGPMPSFSVGSRAALAARPRRCQQRFARHIRLHRRRAECAAVGCLHLPRPASSVDPARTPPQRPSCRASRRGALSWGGV